MYYYEYTYVLKTLLLVNINTTFFNRTAYLLCKVLSTGMWCKLLLTQMLCKHLVTQIVMQDFCESDVIYIPVTLSHEINVNISKKKLITVCAAIEWGEVPDIFLLREEICVKCKVLIFVISLKSWPLTAIIVKSLYFGEALFFVDFSWTTKISFHENI